MIFADFSVNSQPIVMTFYKNFSLVIRRLPWKSDGKLFHILNVYLVCSK